ncbi:MAG: cation-translocating P-type ATPase [Thermoplasmatota archaeon]
MSAPWHALGAVEALERLGSSPSGLSSREAGRRLEEHGPNVLRERPRPGPLRRFAMQFTSAPILMLIGAIAILVALTLLFHEPHVTDAIVIFIVIFVNALMGFIQESKAERAMDALRRLTSPRATVRRDGRAVELDVGAVVPGDILVLEEGDKVPADARLISSSQLEVDESLLTGESMPARKEPGDVVEPGALLQDRTNMVYAGTVVTRGRGEAVATGTGMETEMGRIAQHIQEEEPTPLQRRLAALSRQLGIIAIAAVLLLFLLDRFARSHSPIVDSFLLSVSLAVAIIPEGLPIVTLVTLAVGMQVMARRNAVVRKLMAVETLGSTTYICSDKTGTLTCNQMTVVEMLLGGRRLEVTGRGYAPKGRILDSGRDADATDPALRDALLVMALCNNSHLVRRGGVWQVVGDPTEGALLSVVGKAGLRPRELMLRHVRCGEKVFDSRRKMMTTVHRFGGGAMALVKGAPEVLVDLAGAVRRGGRNLPVTPELREELLRANAEFAARGLRVLALGVRELPGDCDPATEGLERGLTLLGIVGIQDPPRPEVREAVRKCREAGIAVAMITGDQRETGSSVARELGILDGGGVMTGAELERMPEEEFAGVAEGVRVYARVSPEHKLRIVRALQKRGHVVAMTGDGVNDAPALARADIGVAMGASGTDVAREASDMVLTDDNFSSIVAAVEEGRRIYDNIRKFIRYQLTTNVGAIFLIFAATLALLPVIPLYPVQILWVNILMDGPPAVALGLSPGSPSLMRRGPRSPAERLLSPEIIGVVAMNGCVMGALALAFFWWDLARGAAAAHAQTLTFTAFVVFQMFSVFSCNSLHRSALTGEARRNTFLLAAVAVSILLQLAVVYLPMLNSLFHTVPLGLQDWGVILISGLLVLFTEEARKAVTGALSAYRRSPA